MATLTIRDVDDELKTRLRVRAANNGRSMEAEVRAILQSVLAAPESAAGLGSRIRARFADLGGVELDLPARTAPGRSPDFGG